MDARPPPTRLKSLLLFPLGAAFLGYTVYTLRDDGTYHPKLTALGIMLVLMGVIGVIEPRLLNPWHGAFAQDAQIVPLKVTSVLAYAVMFGVGLYPVIALGQGWWLPEVVLATIRG